MTEVGNVFLQRRVAAVALLLLNLKLKFVFSDI